MHRVSYRADLIEIRAKGESEDSASLTFRGHAAVFNKATIIGSRQWGFVEWNEAGAFKDVLQDDVRFLINHDGIPLARTTNSTLTLEEDKTGLMTVAELAPISLSRDLSVLVERGDIDQMSYAFNVDQERLGRVDLSDPKGAGHDGVELTEEMDGMPYRAVTRMSKLYDVSAVTYGAYPMTDAEMVSARFASRDEFKAETERILAGVGKTRGTVESEKQAWYESCARRYFFVPSVGAR